MSDPYQENMFERQLNDIDAVAHHYYKLMDEYFPLPSFEDVILDKLENQYGQDELNNALSIFTSYFDEQEQEMQQAEQNENFPDDDFEEIFKEQPPQKAEEMMRKEQKFRELSNVMCSMTGSLAISLCNILASPLAEKHYQDSFNMLTAMSMAHLYSSRAVSELFPNHSLPLSITYAKRARKNTAVAATLLQGITESSGSLAPVLAPINSLFDKTMKAIGDFITETYKLSEEDFD